MGSACMNPIDGPMDEGRVELELYRESTAGELKIKINGMLENRTAAP